MKKILNILLSLSSGELPSPGNKTTCRNITEVLDVSKVLCGMLGMLSS